MKYKKEIMQILIVVPYVLVLSSYDLIGAPADIIISESLWERIFGVISMGESKALVIAVENLSFIILFGILFGNYVYKHFTVGSVYIFSRIYDRKRWYLQKSSELFLISFCYSVFFVSTNLLICIHKSTQIITGDSYIVAFIIVIYITILLQTTILLINIVSVELGNATGFIFVCIIIVILIGIALSGTTSLFVNLVNPFMVGNIMEVISRWTFMKLFVNIIVMIVMWFFGMSRIVKKDIFHTDME